MAFHPACKKAAARTATTTSDVDAGAVGPSRSVTSFASLTWPSYAHKGWVWHGHDVRNSASLSRDPTDDLYAGFVANAPLTSLQVKGLTSIEDARLDLNTGVTVLVGPNGAGKSNLIDALEVLGRIADQRLGPYVLDRGGVSALMNRPPDPARTRKSITIEAWGNGNGYRVEISSTSDDEPRLNEVVYFKPGTDPNPHHEPLGSGRESHLSTDHDNPVVRHVAEMLQGWRVFHFADTSPDAPPKRLVDTADNLTLQPDGANIAALLMPMGHEHPASYARLRRAVQSVAPFFDDFVLKEEGHGYVRLRWQQRKVDGVFSADAMSDGTLRFICLATLLLQPEKPRTLVLDEPELGMHPFAVHQFVDLLRSATGRSCRAVTATQSTTLLNYFSVEEVAVVERGSTGTTVDRPSASELDTWLEDYSLGDLWEKNLIGGRPRPDSTPRR